MFLDRHKFFLSRPIPQVILTTILNRIKWNSKPPPSPKSRIKLRKSQNVLFSYPWFGAGEEERYKFPPFFCPRYSIGNSCRLMDFALHGGVTSLWLNQVKRFKVLKTNLKLTSCSLWLVYGAGRKGRGGSKRPVSRTLAALPTPTLFYYLLFWFGQILSIVIHSKHFSLFLIG